MKQKKYLVRLSLLAMLWGCISSPLQPTLAGTITAATAVNDSASLAANEPVADEDKTNLPHAGAQESTANAITDTTADAALDTTANPERPAEPLLTLPLTTTPDSETQTSSEPPTVSESADELAIEPAATDTLPATPITEPPLPPTAQDGARPADKAGWVLGIPLFAGFLSQPQRQQYVQEGDSVELDARFTETEWHPSGSEKVFLTKWSWNGERWLKSDDGYAYKATDIGNNKFKTVIRFGPGQHDQLPVGYYYFQLRFTNGNLVRNTYYSQLAKIVVESDSNAATSVNVVPETEIIFPNVEYQIDANIQPAHSTSVVGWQSDAATLDRSFGRSANFHLDGGTIKDWVNVDTNRPGLPVTVTAKANEHYDTTLVHAGGLKAQELPLDRARDQGIQWPVAGMDKLQRDLYAADSSVEVKRTKFKWSYFQKNNRGRYTERSFPKEVKNASGTLDQPTDLNSSKLLAIPGDSAFINTLRTASMNNAAIYAKLMLTLTIKTGRNATKDVNLTTNQARLLVNPPTGKLYLAMTPDFNFPPVTSRQIYQGNQQTTAEQILAPMTERSFLAVVDTRPDNADWTLQATMTPFTAADQQLTQVGIKLKSFAIHPAEAVLRPNQAPLTVAKSSDWQQGAFPVQGELLLDPQPLAQLHDQQKFQAKITWNLTTTQPAAPML